MRRDTILQVLLFLKNLCANLVQLVLSVGVLLMGCILPIYFENGFSTIGTDKFSFFQFVSEIVIYAVVMLFLLWGAADLILYYGLRETEQAKQWWKQEIKLSVTDKFAIFFAAVVYVSFLFSEYPKEAIWGTRGWYMGTFTQLFFLFWYFALSKVWKRVNWIWYIFIASTMVVFLLGILNRFGIYPIDMNSTNPMFISTMGNINWLCGWWCTCIFLVVTLFMLMRKEWFEKKKHPKFVYGIFFGLVATNMAAGLLLGLINGSDSGFLALFAGMLMLLSLATSDVSKMIRFWQIALVLCMALIGVQIIDKIFPESLNYDSAPLTILMTGRISLLLFLFCVGILILLVIARKNQWYSVRIVKVSITGLWILVGSVLIGYIVMLTVNTLYPGSLGELSELGMFTFDDEWGSVRGTTWRSGWRTFWDQNWLHKLIGVGPDCMSAYIYSGENLGLEMYNNYWLKDARLTNAHGEWLTVLVNEGILGLVGYAGMIISAVVRFVKNRNLHWFVMAAGICVVCYTVNNIFSFQQTNNGSALFLIIGIAEGIIREKIILDKNS